MYSSDDKEIGRVAEIRRDGDNNIIELRADIGGFLGFGETRVSLTEGTGGGEGTGRQLDAAALFSVEWKARAQARAFLL